MSETFFVETTTTQSSTSDRWTLDGPPTSARHGKDRPGVKLRSACDFCHGAKVKCSGGSACDRCRAQDLPCTYSVAMRAGKPKGSCNRKTLDKHARIRQQHAARQASLDCGWSPSTAMETGVNDATWFNGVLLGMGLQMEDRNTPGFDHLDYPSDPLSQCLLSPESLPDRSHCPILPLTEEPSFEAHFPDFNQVNFDMPDIDSFSNICSNIAPLPFSPSASPSTTMPNEQEDQEMCTCFADQTHALTKLYSFHHMVQLHAKRKGRSASGNLCRLDICIQHINTALDSSKSFLSCTYCSKEPYSVLITVSSIQLVMRLYEYVVAEVQSTSHTVTCGDRESAGWEALGGEHSRMPCRLGNYEVSPEESSAIRRLVAWRALQKGREVLLSLKGLSTGKDGRVDGSKASGTRPSRELSGTHVMAKSMATQSYDEGLAKNDLTSADTAYIQQLVCRGDAVLDVFLRTVCPV